MRLKIVSDGRKMRNLFVPLILIWPLIPIVMLGPMAVLANLNPRGAWRVLRAFSRFLIFCSDARGMHIEIRNARDNILLYLW
jgi:hypothetical protein